jgi:hypothetical protein
MFGCDWTRLKCKLSIVGINNQNGTTSGLEKSIIVSVSVSVSTSNADIIPDTVVIKVSTVF